MRIALVEPFDRASPSWADAFGRPTVDLARALAARHEVSAFGDWGDHAGVATGDPGSYDLPDFRTRATGRTRRSSWRPWSGRGTASGAGASKWSNRLLLPSYSHPGTSQAGGPGHRGGAGRLQH